MAKVQKISKNITPAAGVFFAHEELKRSGHRKLIDNHIGIRSSTRGYSYGNLSGNMFNLFPGGGEFAEDIQQHFRPALEQIPDNEVASAGTLLRCLSRLATGNTAVDSSAGKAYQFNINEKLNGLNIKSLLLTKQPGKDSFCDFE